ncbi:MAG: DUF4974 domain-containing protein [Muribaculum sp.]|nr:DUF4974 domain-containing protein [Muribaculum sp.]
MDTKDSAKIIDSIFCQPNLPQDISRKFRNWMLENADDPEIDRAMYYLWETQESPAPSADDIHGLRTLINEVDNKRRHRNRLVVAARWLSAAVVCGLLFFCGYLASAPSVHQSETTLLLTAAGSVGKYILPDGTEVWLNGDSKLSYTEDFNKTSRKVDLIGEAYFEVKHDASKPFLVEMGDIEVEVLGTKFDAINYPFSETEDVILRSGRVKVAGSRLQEAIYMSPDDILSFNRSDGRYTISSGNATNYCQWFSPRLIFDNAPLKDVLINLERKYSVEIDIDSKINLDTRLSITLCNEPLDDLMNVMATLMPLRYTISGNFIYISAR